jgi:hypothetical protein
MPLGPTDKLEFKQLPFFPLSSGDQLKSIMFSAPSGFANTSGVLPSGEANFLDFSQDEKYIYKPDFTPKTFTGIDHYPQSIVAPIGLDYYQSKQLIKEPPDYIHVLVNSDRTLNGVFIQALSNGTFSTYFSINDFSIFNPYVHYEASGLTPAVGAPYGAIDNYDENTATDAHYYSWSFDPSSFISEAVTRFNIYSKQYRT